MKKLPVICPSCSGGLQVQNLKCVECDTSISGAFDLPLFLKLDSRDQAFIIDFVMASGSLKVMAQKLGLSYPTVRNMLDDIIHKIEQLGYGQ
jgi:hypothetical protein